jgi:hypothetical protein
MIKYMIKLQAPVWRTVEPAILLVKTQQESIAKGVIWVAKLGAVGPFRQTACLIATEPAKPARLKRTNLAAQVVMSQGF